jgi:hypothetical protein
MSRWKINAAFLSNGDTGKADRESTAIVVLYAKHNYDMYKSSGKIQDTVHSG